MPYRETTKDSEGLEKERTGINSGREEESTEKGEREDTANFVRVMMHFL